MLYKFTKFTKIGLAHIVTLYVANLKCGATLQLCRDRYLNRCKKKKKKSKTISALNPHT